jgi:predicted ester cyclase
MRRVQSAFPDFRNEIDDMIAERNRVFTRLTYTGTHRGEIFGVAPTERKVSYAGAALYRIENAQVAHGWVLGDLTGLLAQLGARVLP